VALPRDAWNIWRRMADLDYLVGGRLWFACELDDAQVRYP
jgi:hypothetical protein